jgi:glycine hydroxymethyltransferase
MADTALALGQALVAEGLPVFARDRGITRSHQLAVEAAPWGGGQAAAKQLREAGLLASGIGLPIPGVAGDLNGLRFGTPEIVRQGMGPADMPALARLVADALLKRRPAQAVAGDVAEMRSRFAGLHYMG